ncbi:hypothetical protein RE943_09960 [Prescottella equi]|nr:hypothetical protein RE943_09960 [Prescottella equi]
MRIRNLVCGWRQRRKPGRRVRRPNGRALGCTVDGGDYDDTRTDNDHHTVEHDHRAFVDDNLDRTAEEHHHSNDDSTDDNDDDNDAVDNHDNNRSGHHDGRSGEVELQ